MVETKKCSWCGKEKTVDKIAVLFEDNLGICTDCVQEYFDALRVELNAKGKEVLRLKSKLSIIEDELTRLYKDNIARNEDMDNLLDKLTEMLDGNGRRIKRA